MEKETSITPDSIGKYLSSLTIGGRSKSTVKAYSADLTPIHSRITTGMTTDQLELACSQYLNEIRGRVSSRTLRRKVASMRGLGKFLGGRDFLDDYKMPPIPAPRPHPVVGLSAGVEAMIDAATNDSHKALVALCGYCGLRISEARAVRPSHFEFRGDSGGVTRCWLTVKGKGEKTREIPITDEVFFILRSRIQECERLGDEAVYTGGDRAARGLITRLGEKAGLGPVASHDLRHTAGTVLVINGSLRIAQQVLGHASPEQTASYSMVGEESMREAMEASTRAISSH